MQINTLAPHTPRMTSARVGRGGKRGKTSGRGTKGQKARSGRKLRPEMRDLIKKIPKLRGHGKNRSRTVRPKTPQSPVNLSVLEEAFVAGDIVNPETLYRKGVVGSRGGYVKNVKILGTGSLTKSLSVSDCDVSTAAQKAIEAAGGSVTSHV